MTQNIEHTIYGHYDVNQWLDKLRNDARKLKLQLKDENTFIDNMEREGHKVTDRKEFLKFYWSQNGQPKQL